MDDIIHTSSASRLHGQYPGKTCTGYLISVSTIPGDTHVSSTCHPHIIPVTCMSSPWSLKTRDDIGDHIYHQHIICMSSPWSLMWSPLTQVIHRLFPLSQMWSPLSEVIHRLSLVPDVVPIDRGHPTLFPHEWCPHINYPCGPWAICTLFL